MVLNVRPSTVNAHVRPATKVNRATKSATKVHTVPIVRNDAIVPTVPNAMPKLGNVCARSDGKDTTVIDRATMDRLVKIARRNVNA